VVARGGEDVWAEIRRRKIPDEDRVPEEFFDMPASGSAAPPPLVHRAVDSAVAESGRASTSAESNPAEHLEAPDQRPWWPSAAPHEEEAAVLPSAETARAPQPVRSAPPVFVLPPVAVSSPAPPPSPVLVIPPVASAPRAPSEPVAAPVPAAAAVAPTVVTEPGPIAASPRPAAPAAPGTTSAAAAGPSAPEAADAAPVPSPQPAAVESPRRAAPLAAPPAAVVAPPSPVAAPPPASAAEPPPARIVPPPGVVLPMTRTIRGESAPSPSSDTRSGLERLLRTAAARGASALYLSSAEQPSVRVDGELQSLDGEPVLTASDVISLLLTLMPDRSHEALRTGATTEWISDIEDIGRVRCMSFRDHRGPGGVFRLMPVRTVSVEQLGLPREIQSLAMEPEGLVLIAGSRSSGKRTLMSALVDLINRTRRDHVITIEREVNIVHARGSSFISQREVRGDDDEVLAAARAALREDPDVLVLEQVRTGLLMNVALEAAASGHLVIGGFSAHNATESIDHIIDLYAPEFSRQVQLALADNLRGVVAQVLLRKTGGGRVPAREVLLNTPAVAGLIAEGKTSQLPMAIEGGRRHGMMPLNDALVAHVQAGVVEVGEAYRQVSDRPAFLALLKRQGVDTSVIERFA
jgi:twitching motility protein PilT